MQFEAVSGWIGYLGEGPNNDTESLDLATGTMIWPGLAMAAGRAHANSSVEIPEQRMVKGWYRQSVQYLQVKAAK